MMYTGIFASSNARGGNAGDVPLVPDWPVLNLRVASFSARPWFGLTLARGNERTARDRRDFDGWERFSVPGVDLWRCRGELG